jgi:hypothetical protein
LMRRVADDDPRWRQSAFGYGCNAAECPTHNDCI